jgi:DNA end-binding protein Ku
MRFRTISRSSISFGLVSIPVELFPATASKSVHFNLLHAKDNSRIQEKIYCVAEDKAIDRSELVHGFQIQKGKYVSFTNEEKSSNQARAMKSKSCSSYRFHKSIRSISRVHTCSGADRELPKHIIS